MNEPRIRVRGKEEGKVKHDNHSDTLNWTGREQPPRPLEPVQIVERDRRADDYWSPYLKKRMRKKSKRLNQKRRPFSSSKNVESQPRGGANQSLLKVIAAGGSAVLVGTLMGLLILKVFVGNGVPEQSNTIDAHMGQSSQSGESEQSTATGADSVTLPEMDPVWIQGGVYSNREGADELVEAQRDGGMAAVVKEVDDQYRVFFGVGVTRDDALSIASQIEDTGIDVYLKDDLPITAVTLNDIPVEQGQKLAQLAEAGQKVISSLGALSTAGISGNDIQDDLANDLANIEQAHQAFLSSLSEIKDELTGDQHQVLDTMDQSLAQAVEAAKQYNAEQSTAYLWQVQEGIMHYLIAYQKLGRPD